MKKHRLLHVLYTGDLAGAEVCVKMLVANMDKSSFDNSVCFLYELGVVGEQIQCLGIPVFNFGMKHGFHFAGALRFLKFIVTKKFDLIHFHAPNVLTILMGRMVCNKVIYHVHNSGKSDGLRRFFLKMLFSFFDKIIAVSCDSKNNFQQTYSIPDSKISIVYNAIDTKRFDLEFDHRAFKQSYGIPLTKPLIGFVGRFVEQKGCELLCEAIEVVRKHRDDFLVLMFGNGPLRESISTLISHKKLENHISLMGTHKNIEFFFHIFDILVVPSRWEPFGIVIIEAMAAGTPVVSFAVGGIPEIIRNGVDGFLIEPNNVQLLAEKIITLLDHQDMREKMGKEAFIRSHDFSIEKYVDSMQFIYSSVLNG